MQPMHLRLWESGVKWIVLGILVLLAGSAYADKPRFGDTVSLSLGGMNHRGKATLSVTNDDAPVDRLTFADLGLNDETQVFWGDLSWQFAERWQFSLVYTSFSGSGVESASTGGNFGDIEWEIGASLSTDFDLDLYIADLTWDFLKTERSHLGVGVGLHAADVDISLVAEISGSIGGNGAGTTVRAESASVLAPLPNASLVGGIMLSDGVYLSGHLGVMSLNYGKYDGGLFSARGALEWRPWQNVGLGAAYQYVDLDVKVDEGTRTEDYDFRFHGPILFLSVGF
jgi:hypothetical protein